MGHSARVVSGDGTRKDIPVARLISSRHIPRMLIKPNVVYTYMLYIKRELLNV